MEAEINRSLPFAAQALVMGSVPCGDWSFLRDYLLPECQIFCADGGVKNAIAAGLPPDFAIGDWDSGGAPVEGVPSVSLSPEKDMTDLQAAMDAALQAGHTRLLLCGCMGGPRLDHTASNLVILEWLACRGGQGMILDSDNEVRLLEEETVVLDNTAGPRYRYFSLVPLDRRVTGVFLEGARYPLSNATLVRGDTLSVSNGPLGPETRIHVGTGRVLLIRSQRL